jgi:hypothetical protein
MYVAYQDPGSRAFGGSRLAKGSAFARRESKVAALAARPTIWPVAGPASVGILAGGAARARSERRADSCCAIQPIVKLEH